jgi:hypothetical protein
VAGRVLEGGNALALTRVFSTREHILRGARWFPPRARQHVRDPGRLALMRSPGVSADRWRSVADTRRVAQVREIPAASSWHESREVPRPSWPLSHPLTCPAAQRKPFSIGSSVQTLSRFSPTPATTTMVDCLATSSRSFAPTSVAATFPRVSLELTATPAATTSWSRSVVTAAAYARVVAEGVWPISLRIWSIESCPTSR